MSRTGYEIFVSNFEELEEGKELEKEIRDAQTYEIKKVRALFSPSAERLAGGADLWVRSLIGHLIDDRPWRIKIIKEI